MPLPPTLTTTSSLTWAWASSAPACYSISLHFFPIVMYPCDVILMVVPCLCNPKLNEGTKNPVFYEYKVRSFHCCKPWLNVTSGQIQRVLNIPNDVNMSALEIWELLVFLTALPISQGLFRKSYKWGKWINFDIRFQYLESIDIEGS